MKRTTWRWLALASAIAVATTGALAAERAWQTGTWREAKVERPKVVFGVAPNDPNTGYPRSSPPASLETRIYVIETAGERFELREKTTVDAPRLDVLIGGPASFAIEKNSVYVKDEEGREHKLSLGKRSAKQN